MSKKLPDNVSFDEGCMVEPSAVSLHAVNLADIKVGDRVLVKVVRASHEEKTIDFEVIKKV